MIVLFLPTEIEKMTNSLIFKSISDQQYAQLKEALGLVTVLIAGADGKIDEQELNWAEKLTYIRSYAKPEELNQFYADVEESFDESVQQLIADLPSNLDERQKVISSRLKDLNVILNILDNDIAFQIYESLTSFAKHIAKASGGFLRFGSISSEEKEWINLPMLDPILREIPEEDSEEDE